MENIMENEIEIGDLASFIYKHNVDVFTSYIALLQREESMDENIFNIFYNLMIDCINSMDKSTIKYIHTCKRDVITAKLLRVLINDKKSIFIVNQLIPTYLEALDKDLLLIEMLDKYLGKIDHKNNVQDLSDIYLILSFIAINQTLRHSEYLQQYEKLEYLYGNISPNYKHKNFNEDEMIDFSMKYIGRIIF
jgi:hypothetical protein